MRLRFVTSVLLCCALTVAADATVKTYGKPLAGLDASPLADVLATPEDGQTVRLEGTIAQVCLKKGCWMVLNQEESTVHVTFEDYSFFVPTDSSGSRVTLEGTVKVEEPDPDHVEHLQGEGAGEEAASKVSVVATGVEIEVPE